MATVALLCTAVLGLLVFGLGLAVSVMRFRNRRLHGHLPEPTDLLHRLVRAHGNAAEYAPFLGVLFLALGADGTGPVVAGLMIGATSARILHAVGLLAGPTMARPNPLRFVGALGTYGCGLALCVILMAVALQPA